jgi:hypothetical protein
MAPEARDPSPHSQQPANDPYPPPSAIPISPGDLFQFRITPEIMNHFNNWQESLDGDKPTQGLYLHRTAQHRNTTTNIHAISGIQIHDLSN